MAKDPAALFFIDAWLIATKEMKAECRGWYVNLVLHQYKNKSLPNDLEELANLADVRISEFILFQQVWQQVLKHKFEQLPSGRLYNPEAAEIIRGREEFIEKRAAAGRMSAFIKFIRRELCPDENIIYFVKQNVDAEQIRTNDQQVLKQVFDHLLQLYINKYKNKDKIEEVIGGMGGREGEREGVGDGEPPGRADPLPEPVKGWIQFPGPEQSKLDLPDDKAKAALELIILAGTKAEKGHIETLWEVFKIQNFTRKKFYQSANDVFSHFINWSKTQKINGTIHPQPTAHGKSTGAVELANKLVEKLTTRREPNPPG